MVGHWSEYGAGHADAHDDDHGERGQWRADGEAVAGEEDCDGDRKCDEERCAEPVPAGDE